MGKIEGSWSGMRKYLEQDMLCEKLRGRIRYSCTSYIGMDGCRIFELFVDGKLFKQFSLETVNTWFIRTGHAEKSHPLSTRDYWDGFQTLLREIPIKLRTEYTDDEFCDALDLYRNSSIQESLFSDNPIVCMFAILDRRAGRASLEKIRPAVFSGPEWLQSLYGIRMSAGKEDAGQK